MMDLTTQKVVASFKPRETNASFYASLNPSSFDSVGSRHVPHG